MELLASCNWCHYELETLVGAQTTSGPLCRFCIHAWSELISSNPGRVGWITATATPEEVTDVVADSVTKQLANDVRGLHMGVDPLQAETE